MKKILLLGGSAQQVVAIETAKKLGYYTVLCDYLSDNPGRYAADQFYLVSTTDPGGVLKVARKEKVDGVLAYASDPAAPTASFVAWKMGLPGAPPASVDILCHKDRFRDFLKKNGFHTPNAKGYTDLGEACEDIRSGTFQFPLIVKPTDSSGSKGVEKIEDTRGACKALKYAMSFSRKRKIIVEEFVEKQGCQIAGDGLSVAGELVFRCFADDHFDERGGDPFVPVCASFPSSLSEEMQAKIHKEIQRLLSLLGMETCTYNFDVRIDKKGQVFLMEVAPRDGGNYIPQLIQYSTGVDLVACSVKAAMGEPVTGDFQRPQSGFYSYYAVHSPKDGVLREICIDPKVWEKNVIENHLLKVPGDEVKRFIGANSALGVLLMKFEDAKQMLHMMDHPEEWLDVKLRKQEPKRKNR